MSADLLRRFIRESLLREGSSGSTAAWISPTGDVLPIGDRENHADVAADAMGASFDEEVDDPDDMNLAFMSQGAIQVRTWPRWSGAGGGPFTSVVLEDLTSSAFARIRDWVGNLGLPDSAAVSIDVRRTGSSVRVTVGDLGAARGPRDFL